VGICNTGNSCYLNSIIQLLNANDAFKRHILEIPNPNPSTQPTIYSLQNILRALAAQGTGAVNIAPFIRTLGAAIYDGSQQDASEVLHIIINNISSEDPSHLINSTFNIELETTIFCPHCGRETKKTDPASLTLSIPISSNLVTSLSNFFSPPAVNDYCCEFCSNYGVSSKINLSHISKTLILTLNRFEFKSGKMTKRNDKMEFPEELTICNHTYKLTGIIMHSGGYYSGHYYAFAKPLTSATWFSLNDSSVRNEENFNNFKHICFGDGKNSLNAYILFYTKVQ
jgi:ubiquitin carboxyl-terminal hydrolase 7